MKKDMKAPPILQNLFIGKEIDPSKIVAAGDIKDKDEAGSSGGSGGEE